MTETHDRPALIDRFGRRISYVRLSVTDRCDLRCRYCMPERMQFLPKAELLSLEELTALAEILIARGVRKIRLTGGEPLVRRGILHLVRAIGARLGSGLEELTLTTNGTQLEAVADQLAEAGVRRINVSLDSLDSERFQTITRSRELGRVLRGIETAKATGLSVKINMVALRGINGDEIADMLSWCGEQGFDLSLIETMPLGEVEADRSDAYLPLDVVKKSLGSQFTLIPSLHRTGGPARYFDVAETGTRLGLISPLSNNFCASCNRIRITATGTVFGCLGHNQKIELRDLLRAGSREQVEASLDELVAGKPERHHFAIDAARPAVARHMSVTGG